LRCYHLRQRRRESLIVVHPAEPDDEKKHQLQSPAAKRAAIVLGAEAAEAEVDLRWIRAARAALLTRFAAKPQTSLRQGVITNDRRASRHQARTRPLASTRRAGRRPRSGSISPVTACDAHASTKHRKRGYRHSGPCQKTPHRPSCRLALLTRCLVLHRSRYSPPN
jgi:hypothetical protein